MFFIALDVYNLKIDSFPTTQSLSYHVIMSGNITNLRKMSGSWDSPSVTTLRIPQTHNTHPLTLTPYSSPLPPLLKGVCPILITIDCSMISWRLFELYRLPETNMIPSIPFNRIYNGCGQSRFTRNTREDQEKYLGTRSFLCDRLEHITRPLINSTLWYTFRNIVMYSMLLGNLYQCY